MLLLYVTTAMLLMIGGAIITVQVLRKPSPFSFLLERGVDPHLWGFHFLGAGSMLSLVLFTLAKTPWSHLEWSGRVAMVAALLWSASALALSTITLLGHDRKGDASSLVPSPEAKLRTWPGLYRAFLALGFVTLGALAWVAL